MTIAIVHYHLGHGGVPQTIRSHSLSLTRLGIPHVILVGSHLPEDASLPIALLPALDYTDLTPATPCAESLADDLLIAASRHLGAAPDLWHIHNHSLGKNPALTQAVSLLAQRGHPLLLHIHDLAEDGRPALYAAIRHLRSIYPYSPRIHYAFLNPRDLSAFLDAGLPKPQTHLLEGPPQPLPPLSNGKYPTPNPNSQISNPQSQISNFKSRISNPQSPTAPLLFAPIRGIRRKNLGELVLLSLLLPPPARIAISRPPADAVSLAVHNAWQTFAAAHAVRIEFAVTDRIPPLPNTDASFASWVHHSTHIVGTSIAEGLGLPFLEASAWQRPFLGRRLPHLRHLVPPHSCYDRILIPHHWIPENSLRQHLEATLARDDHSRQSHPRLPLLEHILTHLTNDGWLDFGNLPEPLQQSVILRSTNPSCRVEIHLDIDGTSHPAIPWLTRQTQSPANTPTPRSPGILPGASHNVNAPTPHHTPLPTLYQSILSHPAAPPSFLPTQAILHFYHTPENFHFLTAPPDPAFFPSSRYRVILFDIYGTLLHTQSGPVKPDPKADPAIAGVIRSLGHTPPHSPTSTLHQAVLDHHAASAEDFPEVDLRTLWQRILNLPTHADLTPLVIATEVIRSPANPIPGAFDAIRTLASTNAHLGLLSNAQSNALHSLHPIANLFDPQLILLSHQLGVAKPSPRIFAEMAHRLSTLNIAPHEVLFVGNDPHHDILPAQNQGWHTALFTPSPHTHQATFAFSHYPALVRFATC